jgi:hypothetical protein
MQRDVLLVGSVGLSNAEEVFRTAGGILGTTAPRYTDGETGNARSVWVQCQIPFLLNNAALEMVEPDPASPDGYRIARVPSGGIYSFNAEGRFPGRARLRKGFSREDVRFDNVGYADWAVESYGVFKRLKAEGAVPATTRFQVSLPSPRAVLSRVLPVALADVEPAYEAGMFADLQRMAANIPREELSIQWDCTEPTSYGLDEAPARRQAEERLIRLGNNVPEGIELGYHLCYGDFEHRHGRQPPDASEMVDLTNAVSAGVTRPIAWVHMPVPRDRSDELYFAPLRNLKMHPDTHLYLGLVHYTDGVEGAKLRMESARKVVSDFGIATECGFGRRPKSQDIRELMNLHVEAAAF